jgi:hypothetical protein
MIIHAESTPVIEDLYLRNVITNLMVETRTEFPFDSKVVTKEACLWMVHVLSLGMLKKGQITVPRYFKIVIMGCLESIPAREKNSVPQGT